jgi:hypothetical protein
VQVPTLDFSETVYAALTYTPATGFVGRDRAAVRFRDSVGNSAASVIDILVEQCLGSSSAPIVELRQGDPFYVIAPETTNVQFAQASGELTLSLSLDGSEYPEAVDLLWSESAYRHVISVVTEELPMGEYELRVPLGIADQVVLKLRVGDGG